MADENEVLEQEQTATEVVASTDPFSEGNWSETLPNAAENTTSTLSLSVRFSNILVLVRVVLSYSIIQ